MTINDKLKALRAEMQKEGIQAVIVPSSDPHLSEYLADHWKSREWISGFYGSAGTALITEDFAGLWTDARYFIQAEKELASSEFQLMKIENQFSPQYMEWLIDQLPTKSKVAVDGWSISYQQYQSFKKQLKRIKGELISDIDLIDRIWQDRPSLPVTPIFVHDVQYAGKSRKDKLALIRKKMEEDEVDYYLLTALDDIGWVLNLRGSDVECNPVFIAYLIVSKDKARIYVDDRKLNIEISDQLVKDGIEISAYDQILDDLNHLDETDQILVDVAQVNSALYRAINGEIVAGKSIAKWEKARKNDTEASHVRNCMAKDGAALAESFFWLENVLQDRSVSEYELAMKLKENRSAKDLYYGESFHAIVGYKDNGAIMHYRPTEIESAQIQPDGMLLVDSGGQYHDGTTDITRTFSLNDPTADQKRHYTLVLKGMIALTQAIFPRGTSGGQLDTLARQFLWAQKLDFGHGTGHGVGFFMNVHEPPQGFANIRSERGRTSQEAGMITSNEPGFYLEGAYGIRLENLVLTIDKEDGFLGFETLTLYPFAHNLMDLDLLSHGEIEWLDQYHTHVMDKVKTYIQDEVVKEWFSQKCRKIS